MIRLKHRIYPVWLEWEGEEGNFNNARVHILEDIKQNGFKHWDAFEDITDQQSPNQQYWDKEEQLESDTSQLHDTPMSGVTQPPVEEGKSVPKPKQPKPFDNLKKKQNVSPRKARKASRNVNETNENTTKKTTVEDFDIQQ